MRNWIISIGSFRLQQRHSANPNSLNKMDEIARVWIVCPERNQSRQFLLGPLVSKEPAPKAALNESSELRSSPMCPYHTRSITVNRWRVTYKIWNSEASHMQSLGRQIAFPQNGQCQEKESRQHHCQSEERIPNPNTADSPASTG